MLTAPIAAVLFATLLLASCGGGGGSGGGSSSTGGSSGGSTGPVTSTLSFPFKAIDDAERVTNRYVTGTISGSLVATPTVTFSGTFTNNIVYSPSTVFSYIPVGSSSATNVNANANTSTAAIILSNFSNGAGTQAINSTDISYYNDLGTLLGSKSSPTPNNYNLVTSGGQVPISGKVGDQGQLYSEDIVNTSSGIGSKCGTEVLTYLVQPDTATTVIVKAVLTRSITNAACGVSAVFTGYTRYTQTSSKALYQDVADASSAFKITFN